MELLNKREKTVLELVMEHYILSADPIGSGIISKTMKYKLSSATIRNIMGDLEALDFLYKPHSVAGRIPTPKAFRYYVNSLPPRGIPGKKDLKTFESLMKPRYTHVEEVMEDASKILAAMSSCTSIVVEPKVDTMLFQEVEFVKLSRHTILMVFVTSSGTVHKRLVEIDEDLGLDVLIEMKEYMNRSFSGIPFYALKNALLQDLKKDRETFTMLYEKIKNTLDIIIGEEEKREVYIEGTSKMIGVPEFSDIEKLKELFKALENKEKLLKLFDRCLRQEEGVNVVIGNESDVKEMRNISIIMSAYQISEKSWGILGVIGPMRMNYSKIMPLVDYTARTMTGILRIM
ncbi:MAG: heat-inducible transcriptional repressor HrcA [Methanoregulaceae archaeon]|nr:heat-inducible transcriptional repressor HrcA [Methanoregulaceae archaeon]